MSLDVVIRPYHKSDLPAVVEFSPHAWELSIGHRNDPLDLIDLVAPHDEKLFESERIRSYSARVSGTR
ncbi:MAG: hypothetical protein ACJ74R_11960 [Gaiellaceae bacterium]